MPLYTEPVIREPNHRGKLRLVTELGKFPGAVGRGFDGDGTPPKRGRNEEAGRRRVWWFPEPLRPPWSPGVAVLPQAAYDALSAAREQTKPKPVEVPVVRATYFEPIGAGTDGRIAPPNSAGIVLDQWEAGVDALASTGADGWPDLLSPLTEQGDVVTATLDMDGNWGFSGAPATYPVFLIYVAEGPEERLMDRSRMIEVA